ncbi:gamma-glutamyl-gamma-aminobutyrate hydrolase family protein [Streptomyces antimycoticus]
MSSAVRRPLIAVTLGHDLPERPATLRLPRSYVRALVKAGATPIAVPPGVGGPCTRQVMEQVDGLFLPGGVDPHPRPFGEEVHPETTIDEELDALELNAITCAVSMGMPILGVCRGSQILNVALGGSLIQHLDPGTINHYRPDLPLSTEVHEVRLADDSRLAKLSGTHMLRVNSLHHQAISRSAPELRVVAQSEDGLAEAVEALDPARWMIGVQYHPEELLNHEAHSSLFDGFVSACSEFASERRRTD